ncbi:peptidylprolyl isomerase [soil metagenome]
MNFSRFALAALLSATCSVAGAQAAAERVKPLDGIVAVVNDEVITRNELDLRYQQITNELRSRGTQPPAPAVFERQVLERMVVDRAQTQLAKENGIRVDDLTLDRSISRIAEANGVTVQQYRDRIERGGASFPRVRELIRDEIVIQRVREREVDSRVTVSDAEIDEYIRSQANADSQVEINVAQVYVSVPGDATPDQVERRRQKAAEALRQIKSGTDFARVALSFSEGMEATRGGEFGWRTQDRYPPWLVEAVKPLKQGDTTDIVRSTNGFHILKVLGKRNEQAQLPASVAQTHPRHILLRTGENGLTDAEAQRRLSDYRDRIVNKTDTFADLARRYSRDGSASNGGDLGWIYPGDTVPEFERVMNALQPGEISQPVQTPFGWHLILVEERKEAEVSVERKRQAARQAVGERKAEENYFDWVRELRDKTYVEIRLDDAPAT